MLKVISVKVRGFTEQIRPECPNCGSVNFFSTHNVNKGTIIRSCDYCNAILEIVVQEET